MMVDENEVEKEKKEESHKKAIENARKVIEIVNQKSEETKEDGDEM